MTRAERNSARRLHRILNDEEFGPKLVRLGRRDARRVLDAVDANDGKRARELIVQLDDQRRARRRAQPAEVRRRAARRSGDGALARAVAHARRILPQPNVEALWFNLALMLPSELIEYLELTRVDIIGRIKGRGDMRYFYHEPATDLLN